MTGAIHHYRAALRLEPDYPGGVDLLRIPSCYLKYHLSHTDPSQSPGPSHCTRGNSLTNIQVRHTPSPHLLLLPLPGSYIDIPPAQKCRPRAQCCLAVQQAGCGDREKRSCSCNSCIPAKPQPSYEVSHSQLPRTNLLTVFQLHADRLIHYLTPTHCSSFHLTNIL